MRIIDLASEHVIVRLTSLAVLVALGGCGEPGDADEAGGDGGVETGEGEDPSETEAETETPGDAPLDVDCDAGGPPQTIDCLYRQVIDNDITTVEDVIPLLSEDLRTGLFLMEESRSRHQASRDYPRVILYGSDARFIFSMSTTPTDPLLETIEMIELQDDGELKFRQLDMSASPPKLGADDVACQACHGPRPRLIWGQYRTWPGSYEVGPSNTATHEALQERIPDRFGALIVKPYDASPPAWSVEVWNYQQNRVMMEHHAQRMKASAAYTTKMRYQLVSAACGGYDVGSAMQELGFSPADTRADLLVGEVQDTDDIDWYGGGGSVADVLIDVAAIDVLYMDGDTELEAIVAPYNNAACSRNHS